MSTECLGQGGECDVAVPAGVAAAFEVVESESVFEFAVVVLDPPADLGESDQLWERGVGGQVRQPVVGGFGLIGRPFGDEPAFRQAAVGVTRDFPVGR